MTDIQFKNNAYSTLAADISAVSTSLSVQSGDGVLFPAISGSQYFRCTLYDASGNLEIIKVTARTVDSFGTIVRGEEGTTARAFTSGDRIALQLTDEGIRDKVGQEINDAVIQAAMPTLDKDSPEYIVLTPTAAGTLPLPTTGVPDGKRFCIVNLATNVANGVRVNASGGAQVTYAPASSYQPIPVEVMALQDDPTTAAHWAVLKAPKGILHLDEVSQDIAATSYGNGCTIPADLLHFNGAALRWWMAGSASTAVIIEMFLGASSLAGGALTIGSADWLVMGMLLRRGSASEHSIIPAWGNGATVQETHENDIAEDLTTALLFRPYNQNATYTKNVESIVVELL